MPRLVTKFGYIRPGKRKSPGGYARYIATREGVECIDDSHKYDPATQAQKRLIRRILHDFPDMEQSPAYQAYSREPTRGWASSFISCSLQENGEQITGLKTYADYIATRPGAERFGSHGLFTDEGMPVHLFQVSRELNQYPGRVYTGILSLTREDAQRLGFESGSRWRDFLRGHRQTLAEQFKIPPGHLKWYAAFHNAGHHPHVHLIVYSALPGEGHLSKQGVENLRSAFARDIFSQDLLCTYQRQTGYRDELRQESRAQMERTVEEINRGSCENPVIRMLILEIARQLSRTSGKKIYGYLKPETKALVDSVVAELAKDERIQTLYDLWYTQREDVLRTYTNTFPERIPLERNPEFKAIRNAVIQEAVKAVPEGPVTMPLRTSLPKNEDKDDGEKDDCKTVNLKTEIDSAALVFEPIRPAGPKKLYEQYLQGASMRELLASMQQTGVTYGEGMPWNLNRISRLLSDGRYVGKGSYPAIITQEVFETVTQKKEKKAPAVQVTQAYKVLRQKCGKKITVHIQQEVLYLLNTLAGRPDRIKKPVVPISKNQRLLLLQSELEEIMQELPVDEGRATQKLLEIAQVMYENIDPREYETRRLRRIFGKEECNPELDADLIAATVEEILVDGNDRVRLRLKNDQILERGK